MTKAKRVQEENSQLFYSWTRYNASERKVINMVYQGKVNLVIQLDPSPRTQQDVSPKLQVEGSGSTQQGDNNIVARRTMKLGIMTMKTD